MSRSASGSTRVSTIELFFDLVFVFSITQVATVIVARPDAAGVLRAALELSVIFWMYGGYAWLTNANEPDTLLRRLILLAGMAAFYLCAIAVVRAFDGDGIVFGVAYVAVNLVHGAGLLVNLGRASVRWIARVVACNLVSSLLILGAGWMHGPVVAVVWTLAALFQLTTPFLISVGDNFEVSTAHFGERHGLVILIVLGESLVSVAVASQHEGAGLRLALGVLAGLLVAAVMWWLYFGGDDEAAVAAMERAAPRLRPVWAITGYFLAHLLMIFGILLLAAGSRLASDDLLARGTTATAWLIAAGVGTYSLGSAAFRRALRFADPVPRALAAGCCLLAVPVGLHLSTAAELVALAGVLLLVLAVEAVTRRATAAGDDAAIAPSGAA